MLPEDEEEVENIVVSNTKESGGYRGWVIITSLT
jgi:hypothetical protein